MSAPDRIWAWEYKGNSPWGERKPDLSVVTNGAEYVRADIAADLLAALESIVGYAKMDPRSSYDDIIIARARAAIARAKGGAA